VVVVSSPHILAHPTTHVILTTLALHRVSWFEFDIVLASLQFGRESSPVVSLLLCIQSKPLSPETSPPRAICCHKVSRDIETATMGSHTEQEEVNVLVTGFGVSGKSMCPIQHVAPCRVSSSRSGSSHLPRRMLTNT
jgi:hypothetical protein